MFKMIFTLFVLFLFTTACSNAESTNKRNESKQTELENVELTISAAASLKDAMDEISGMYTEEHSNVTLNFNFGGSGSLQQQISQGAPVDLFFSAAEDKFDTLVEEGTILSEDSIDLLGNSLVLVVPKDSDKTISSFEDLSNKEIKQFSIGTPETVPAGKYAKESLEKIGIWEEVSSKIVFTKDVTQVLTYVETGNVEAGIVYKTDGIGSEKVSIVATADPRTHTLIIYPVGVIKESAHYEDAKDFFIFLQSDAALKVFEKYGFTIQ